MLPVREGHVQESVKFPLRSAFATVAGALLFAGCASPPPAIVSVEQQNLGRAEALVDAGNIDAAMAIYAELAAATVGPERAVYALAAARLALTGGDIVEARHWLTEASDTGGQQEQAIIVVAATIELEESRPEFALQLLDRLAEPPAPETFVDALGVRGRALFALTRVEEAVTALVERELWLNDGAAVIANHELIWGGLLEQIGSRPVVTSGNATIDGWLALQPVATAYRSDPSGLERGLVSWRDEFPSHPAADIFLPILLERFRLSQIYPGQVALLLPLSNLGQQAAAIRDGFIAAHLRTSADSQRTHIKVYDTDELGSDDAYRRAELDGAEFIIGPLLKPNVDRIVTSAGFTPTLALNFAQNELETPNNFYQFALAPEDEAIEVARHAFASGAQTAVALIPNSDWGQRLLASFTSEFERLGGSLLEFGYYNTNSQNFSLPITTLLNIADSNQRRQRLAANLGVPLEFEPRRRQDVDMIFLATNAANGRQLAPQLRFYYAGDLPTYATREIYGPVGAAGDFDLDGILFPDSPWLLSPDATAETLKTLLTTYWPQHVEQWPRLFAMGFDAYRLIPLLYNTGASFTAIPAMSGELSLNDDGRVHRRLPLAQFREGLPIPLGGEAAPVPPEITDAH